MNPQCQFPEMDLVAHHTIVMLAHNFSVPHSFILQIEAMTISLQTPKMDLKQKVNLDLP
jgi:hypothetical protein